MYIKIEFTTFGGILKAASRSSELVVWMRRRLSAHAHWPGSVIVGLLA